MTRTAKAKPPAVPTVGEARALLTRASRRPVRDMVCKIPTPRAIEILRAAFDGRPASSQISAWVADVVSMISCRRGRGRRPVYPVECGCFWCRRDA